MYSGHKYLVQETGRRRQNAKPPALAGSPVSSILTTVSCKVGFPIRKSPDQRLFAAPRGLSQRTTSFIASYRLGIHQTPFSRLIRDSESKSAPAEPERSPLATRQPCRATARLPCKRATARRQPAASQHFHVPYPRSFITPLLTRQSKRRGLSHVLANVLSRWRRARIGRRTLRRSRSFLVSALDLERLCSFCMPRTPEGSLLKGSRAQGDWRSPSLLRRTHATRPPTRGRCEHVSCFSLFTMLKWATALRAA